MVYHSTVLIASFILLLLVALPMWRHSRKWGYAPSSGLGLVVVALIMLALNGRI
jgi:hypothetical protein